MLSTSQPPAGPAFTFSHRRVNLFHHKGQPCAALACSSRLRRYASLMSPVTYLPATESRERRGNAAWKSVGAKIGHRPSGRPPVRGRTPLARAAHGRPGSGASRASERRSCSSCCRWRCEGAAAAAGMLRGCCLRLPGLSLRVPTGEARVVKLLDGGVQVAAALHKVLHRLGGVEGCKTGRASAGNHAAA